MLVNVLVCELVCVLVHISECGSVDANTWVSVLVCVPVLVCELVNVSVCEL